MAGTPVALADGSFKPIETIKAGDTVLSRNERGGKIEARQVLQTSVRNHIATLTVTFDTGETVETTGEHPFYVVDEGFVAAGRLAIGNAIVTRAGPAVRLTGVVWNSTPKTVYNFTVEGDHTYFVGKNGLWVHNIECDANGQMILDLQLPEPEPHGNSLRNSRRAHVYQIMDRTSGNLYKYGESNGPIINGKSARAESQVRGLNNQGGDRYYSRILRQAKNKRQARQIETDLIQRYAERKGARPPGNLSDH